MAVLELGIEINGLPPVSNGLKDLQKTISGINGVKIDFGSSQLQEAKTQAIQANTAIKEMIANANIGNAKFLTDLKGEGIKAKTELIGVSTEIKKLESASKINISEGLGKARIETENARKALIDYNLEQKKLKELSKQQTPSLTTGEGSIVQMRTRLNELRKVYDNLSESARNSARVQNNLVTEINRINQAVSKAEQATGRFQRNVGNYSSALGNANGVTMEFNRIIQDAPFGMMGIGNNIQQLAANWQTYASQAKAAAAANGQTIGTMGLLKGVASNFLTTGNLLTFGIAAITSGYTAWTMWQQKANKSVKEGKSELESYKETMNSFQQAQLQAVNSYGQEIARLGALFKITQDVNSSVEERKNALSKLQEIYPTVFKNLDIESVKTANASKQYNTLRNSIIAAAKAQAAFAKIGELAGTDFTNSERQLDLSNEYTTIYKTIGALKTRAKNLEKEANSGVVIGKIYEQIAVLEDKANDIRKKSLDIQNERTKTSEQQNRLAESAVISEKENTGEQEKGGKLAKEKTATTKEQFDYLQKIRDLLADKKQELDAFGLKGQAKELQELKNKYFDFYNELDKLEKKASKDKNAPKGTLGAIQDARGVGSELENKQRAEIISKWNEIYVQLTNEGLTKAGLISENARQKELSSWSKYVADLKVKMSEASTDMNAVNEFTSDLLRNGTRMIELKFSIEDVEGIKKDAEKIAEDLNKPFTAKNPASLQSQIDERIRIFKDSTIKLAEAMKLAGFNVDMKQVNGYINEQSIKIQKQGESDYGKRIAIDFKNKLVDEFNTSFKSLFTNLQSNIDELGLSFSSVFYSLGATLQSSINNVNTDSINNIFEKFKTSGWEAVNGIDKAVAGLSTAGNLIQSIVSQSSVAGQGIGGALSGAGAGLSVGSMISKNGGIWGAAIGGVVGLVSGIFGGKKKRKEEERQRQQLEEQKKTNALLERMNALAYTSSIIGGKTTDGIVTGVNRNEFGEITFRIEGKDLVTSLSRQNAIGSR